MNLHLLTDRHAPAHVRVNTAAKNNPGKYIFFPVPEEKTNLGIFPPQTLPRRSAAHEGLRRRRPRLAPCGEEVHTERGEKERNEKMQYYCFPVTNICQRFFYVDNLQSLEIV